MSFSWGKRHLGASSLSRILKTRAAKMVDSKSTIGTMAKTDLNGKYRPDEKKDRYM